MADIEKIGKEKIMQISGVQGSQQAGVNKKQSSDPIIKEAQDKIAELQKRMKELVNDDTLDAKSKAEQKKEMQAQISELNTQIKQRQAELRKQEYESKKARESKSGGNVHKGDADAFSVQGTNALLSACNAVKISDALGDLAKGMELTARRLSSEIETDIERGADVSVKENMLSDLKKGIANTKSNQLEILVDANITMNSAAEDEEEGAVVEDTEEDEETEGENAEGSEGDTSIKSDGMIIEGIYDKDGKLSAESKEESDYEDRA